MAKRESIRSKVDRVVRKAEAELRGQRPVEAGSPKPAGAAVRAIKSIAEDLVGRKVYGSGSAYGPGGRGASSSPVQRAAARKAESAAHGGRGSSGKRGK